VFGNQFLRLWDVCGFLCELVGLGVGVVCIAGWVDGFWVILFVEDRFRLKEEKEEGRERVRG
jgi:hypothetical protein